MSAPKVKAMLMLTAAGLANGRGSMPRGEIERALDHSLAGELTAAVEFDKDNVVLFVGSKAQQLAKKAGGNIALLKLAIGKLD